MTRLEAVEGSLKLLRDNNLVWSADFDAVRLPLADLIESMAVALDAASELVASLESEFPNV